MLDETRKIGIGLTGFGLLFLTMGVLLLFDRALLAMGNVLFLCGVTLLIGVSATIQFFMQPHKLRGTICFLGGIIVVFMGHSVIGLIIESFGFINLFGNFFPTAIAFIRQVPFFGHILNLPVISTIVDKITGAQDTLPV